MSIALSIPLTEVSGVRRILRVADEELVIVDYFDKSTATDLDSISLIITPKDREIIRAVFDLMDAHHRGIR